ARAGHAQLRPLLAGAVRGVRRLPQPSAGAAGRGAGAVPAPRKRGPEPAERGRGRPGLRPRLGADPGGHLGLSDACMASRPVRAAPRGHAPGFRRPSRGFVARVLPPRRAAAILGRVPSRADAVSSSFFLVLRILFAWLVAILLAGSVWGGLFGGIGGLFVLLAMCALGLAVLGVATHIRRVRLLAGRLDATVLANRQQRRIELPMEADAAFDLVADALRQLPRGEDIEPLRGGLQLRGRVRRSDPFGGARPSRWNLLARFAVTHDRVLATVHPGTGTVGVTVLCEPDAAHWVDLFALDEGSNYENAESVLRALSRQVAAQRREEQARAEREATDNALTVARLNLLQAQVEPHFLYNTLANAQVLAR